MNKISNSDQSSSIINMSMVQRNQSVLSQIPWYMKKGFLGFNILPVVWQSFYVDPDEQLNISFWHVDMWSSKAALLDFCIAKSLIFCTGSLQSELEKQNKNKVLLCMGIRYIFFIILLEETQ